MADFGFQGPSALALDAKGRLTVPVRHRDTLERLSQGQHLTVTLHPAECLLIFPRPKWEAFRSDLAKLTVDSVDWKRLFIGNAMDVEIDSAFRMLVPPELRAAVGLDKEVMLLGMDSHFELWDAVRYAEHRAKIAQRPMPDELRKLSY